MSIQFIDTPNPIGNFANVESQENTRIFLDKELLMIVVSL